MFQPHIAVQGRGHFVELWFQRDLHLAFLLHLTSLRLAVVLELLSSVSGSSCSLSLCVSALGRKQAWLLVGERNSEVCKAKVNTQTGILPIMPPSLLSSFWTPESPSEMLAVDIYKYIYRTSSKMGLCLKASYLGYHLTCFSLF